MISLSQVVTKTIERFVLCHSLPRGYSAEFRVFSMQDAHRLRHNSPWSDEGLAKTSASSRLDLFFLEKII